MNRWMTMLGATALVSGCTPVVLDPFGGSSGQGGADESTTASFVAVGTGSSSTGSSMNALALKGSDVTPGSIEWNSDQFTPWSNPDALVLFMSDHAQTCAKPAFPTKCDQPDIWQTILVVPPEVDAPGIIDLSDPRIGMYEFQITNDNGCGRSLASGNAAWGTLEIFSSDANGVSFELRDSGGSGHPPANGDYTAQRCGGVPPPPPVQAAIAFRGTDLPPPPAGVSVDPDSLYVFLGTAHETCQDPWSTIDCMGSFRMAFRLPPSLQKVGIVNLSDPALAATFAVAKSPIPGCELFDGSFTQGSLTISSIDDGGISFRVVQSYSTTGQGDTIDADGFYKATLCP